MTAGPASMTSGVGDGHDGDGRDGADPSEVLGALAAAGFEEAEVYLKRGRSRRLEHTPWGQTTGFHHERGWAVRAGGRRASLFTAGTGDPDLAGPWPEPDGKPLRLPDPQPAPPWTEPGDFDAPLIGEREGLRLLESLERELGRELPGGRLLAAVLEDGSSDCRIANRRGVDAAYRNRLAALRVVAVGPAGPGGTPATAALYLAEREARRFDVPSRARRLAARRAGAAGAPPAAERARGEVLAAPAVAARLIEGLLPLVVGPEAAAKAAALRDRRGLVAGEALTLVDDGRLAGGTLAAPYDGEGMPTGETVLIDQGAYRQPLLAWDQVRGGAETRPTGCSRRPSWRDPPRPGPSHLYVRPHPGVAVAGLLDAVARGYYLLDATGPGRFDLDADRFELPVRGFAVVGGRAAAAVGSAVLAGGIGALLRGVGAVARDLRFFPLGGMIGAPTLLLTGLEIRGTP
jgi:predicted Zn-dependent protease